MFDNGVHGSIVWLIIVLAIVTFLTRIGGHMLLAGRQKLHPRIAAGLEAVPAAVMTTLVVPPAFFNGVAEAAAILFVGIISLRIGPMASMALGMVILVGLRQAGL